MGETLEQAEKALELEVVMAKRELLKAAVDFTVRVDPAFNERVLLLLDVLILHVKDTDVFQRGDSETKRKIESAIEAIRKQSATEKRSDVAGDDIVGEDWIDDVARFIEATFRLITQEKDFFFRIIRLIICGCKE